MLLTGTFANAADGRETVTEHGVHRGTYTGDTGIIQRAECITNKTST